MFDNTDECSEIIWAGKRDKVRGLHNYLLLISLFAGSLIAALPNPAKAATYYCDPLNGNTNNIGSSASPWGTLQSVFEMGKIGNSVGAGDTILLRTGYHGTIDHSGTQNSDYITIAAQPGHTPTFKRIKLTSCSKWIWKGLTISPEFAPVFETVVAMVEIRKSNDIIIEDNIIYSIEDSSEWTADDWLSLASRGFYLYKSPNLTIRNNTVTNIAFGIAMLWGHYTLIEYNDIQHNIGDGIQAYSSSNVTIQYNTLKNFYRVDTNHTDGIQFYHLADPPCDNVILRGNRIIQQDPDVDKFPGTMQGIGCFDGPYNNWLIENNVVITPHVHGIAMYELVNSTIINNIAYHPEPLYPNTGVAIHTGFGLGSNVVIRNNMASNIHTQGTNITHDHNIVIDTDYDAGDLFVDYLNNNYTHKPGNPAIDAGSSLLAPDIDILGTSRPQGNGYDIGAYEYLSGPPDTTPPSIPQNLTAQVISESRIDLTWSASTDPESGVRHYRIYRDALLVDTSISTSYSDTGVAGETTYSYEVSAVNGAGLESGLSNTAQATTLSDITPPTVLSVMASETSVTIVFSEPLDTVSAEQISNYTINNGISVIAASLNIDTVTLTTSFHPEGSYSLSVTGVQDTSGNVIAQTQIDYQYTEGLVGHWKFDEAAGTEAFDSSGLDNTGILVNGPAWTQGKFDAALRFDGADDAVEIATDGFDANEGTVALWAYAEGFSSAPHFLFGHTTQPVYSNRIQLYTDDINGNLDLGLGNSHTTHTNIQDLDVDTWYHIALSWDGTDYAVYVDGQLQASGTYSALTTISNHADIGNNGTSAALTEPFNGILDEVRIYNRALNANEVLELYNNGSDDPTHTVTASAQAGGSITPDGTLQIADGDNQTFTITPQAGYHIADVLVDGSSVGAVSSYSFTNVTSNHTISASFVAVATYTITATAGSGGQISPDGSTQVTSGGTQAYTITPDSGYQIADVLVDGSSVGTVSSYSFTNVTSNHTISASFVAAPTYTITATAGSGGQISPNGATQVTEGGSQAYTITANAGYQIADVLVDGSSVGTASSYSFTNVTSNHTISTSFEAADIDTNLVGHWELDETSGTIAQDSSGSGNSGILANGPVWTPGKYNNALLFDGTNDYVDCGSDSSLNLTGSLTISTWISPASFGQAGWGRIVDKSNGSTGLSFLVDADTKSIQYVVYGGSVVGSNSNVISLNTWQHAGVVYSESSQTVTFYVNGQAAGTSNYQTKPIDSSSDPLVIGIRGYDMNRAFNGKIDDVRIYNRALTSQEMLALYNDQSADPTYTVTASAGSGGQISPNGSAQVISGGTQAYTITPDAGYQIADVLVDGSSVGAVSSYSFTTVASNHTISASFSLVAVNYTITASAGSGGQISPNGAAQVTSGGTQAYTITPDSGYQIADVLVNGSSVGAVSSYSFTTVASNHTISASFDVANIDTNLVGHWKLDDDMADGVIDSSSYGNDGTAYGNPQRTTNRDQQADQAYDFDGVDDYITIPDSDEFDFLNFTITYWEKVGSYSHAGNDESRVVSKGLYQWAFGHAKPASGSGFSGLIRKADGTGWWQPNFGNAPTIGEWTHVAFRVSNSGNSMEAFKNGVSLGVQTQTGGMATGSSDVFIGRRRSNDEYFNGSIDEVRIYDRALTSQEILALYNDQSTSLGTATMPWTNVVDYWYDQSVAASITQDPADYTITSGQGNITVYEVSVDTVNNRARLYTGYHTRGAISALTIAGVEGSVNYTCDTGLVGDWKFDEYSGLEASDSSGSDNTAILVNGAKWTGQGDLSLDGGGAAARILTSGLKTSSGTVSLWAYADNYSGVQYFFGHTQSGANDIKLYAIGNQLCAELGQTVVPGIDTLVAGVWYNIALTWDGTSYAVYINAIERAAAGYSGLNALNASADIGNNGGDLTEALKGYINDVKIYDRALNAVEISDLYFTCEVNENRTLTLYLNNTDSNGDPITYSFNPLGTGATFDQNNNTLTWTPWYSQEGSYEITFTDISQQTTQPYTLIVHDIVLKTWYQQWLEHAGKL